MKMSRSKLGSKLFSLASEVYEGSNPLRAEVGDMLFKLAAKVSPDKPKKSVKKRVKKTVKKAIAKK